MVFKLWYATGAAGVAAAAGVAPNENAFEAAGAAGVAAATGAAGAGVVPNENAPGTAGFGSSEALGPTVGRKTWE